MIFKEESNRIYLDNEEGKLLAEVSFPLIKDGVVDINHTFVDPSLRGQGVAGKLMEEVVKRLKDENIKAILSCSYAVNWFDKRNEYEELLVKE